MSEEKTISYYNTYAQSFAQSTRGVDFTAIQNKFLDKLPAGAFILDFGCGSGRDTRYFLLIRYTVIKNTKEAINTFCAIFNLLFAL